LTPKSGVVELVQNGIKPGVGNIGISIKNDASRQLTAECLPQLLIDTTPALNGTTVSDRSPGLFNQRWLECTGFLLDLLGWSSTKSIDCAELMNS
jgi:hypothetical protein